MFNSWHFKYAFLMSGLFAITVGYNACSEDAGFDLVEGVESLEEFNTEQSVEEVRDPEPSVVINNDSEYTRTATVNLTLDPDGPAVEMKISVQSDCSDGSWEPYQQNKNYQLQQLNQDSSVYVQYKDDEDFTTACVSDSIIHDDIPPVVQFTQGAGSLWVNDRNMSVLYTVTDSGSGVREIQCDRNGSGLFQACGNNVYYSNLTENANYLLVVRAFDRAGNMASPEQLNWRPDFTPPTVVFNNTPAAVTADVTPDFSFLGTDLGSGVAMYECQLDGAGYAPCSSPMTLTGLADGAHSFSVRATDNVGHVSPVISHSWVQDTMAPTIEFTQTPNPLENSGNASFAFRVIAGDIASYRCQIDGGGYQPCTSPHNLTGLGDGSHTFSVMGVDSVGNMSSPISYTWTIDSMAPTIAFSETPMALESSTNARFSFVAQDGGSGIARIECRVDMNAYSTCQPTMAFSNLSNGSHTLQARAVDNAGNISAVISYTWVIDNIAPTVTIDTHPTDPSGSANANFTFTATDGVGSGVNATYCKVDGNAYASCTSPATFSDLSDGLHIFSVYAEDQAGNSSNVETYQWYVDTTGPQITFVFAPNPVEYIGSTPKILFTADDGAGSGVVSEVCLYNNAAYTCASNMNYDFPATAVSQHSFQVTATDAVGNSTTEMVNWSVQYQLIPRQMDVKIKDDRPVDILFIIDNSGSMNGERQNLAQRVDGLINVMNGLDWQMAVTSTDVSNDRGRDWEDGRIVDFTRISRQDSGNGLFILDSSMDPDYAQNLFAQKVQAHNNNSSSPDYNPYGIYHTEGSGDEQAIRAAHRMLQRSQDPSAENAPNRAFVRDGADLVFIVVSDENENSNGQDVLLQPQAFLDSVSVMFNNQKTVTWHSIIYIPGDDTCSSGRREGFLYYELSMLTGYGQPGGAIVGSVCDSNYTANLTSIGDSVVDMQKSFSLECQPLDVDNDGQRDMMVSYQAAGTQGYVDYPGTFVIQGQKIIFDDLLPPGDFRFNFNCNQVALPPN